MRVEVLTDVDRVVALGDDWNRLDADFDAPVVRHDWVVAALEHLTEGQRAEVVCVFDGSDLVAAAPLARTTGPFGRAAFAGQDEHAEPTGVVYRDHESLGVLLDALTTLGTPMILRRLLAGSPVVAGLEGRRAASVVTRAARSCPTLEIPPDTSVNDVLSSSLRGDLRRARRRAAEYGEVTFEMHAPVSPEELAPLWDESVRVEASGWKGRSGTALHHHETLHAFFAAYASRAAERKHLRIGLLEFGGEPASALIATEWADRLWLLKMGYDERFGPASPGMLLLEGAVGHAIDRRLHAVEFLGSSAPWTRRWTRLERSLATVRVYPRTAAGRVRCGADAARRLAGRIVRPGSRS